MQQSGFRSTPITKALLYTLLTTSLLASLTSTKPSFHLQILPHLLTHHQLHRIPAFQTIYANAGELLFSSLLLYQLRVVERLFGSRKFLSVTLYAYATCALLAPTLLLLGWILTRGKWNYFPPGPTPLLFALLAQFHAVVPGTYRVAFVLPGGGGEVSASDKALVYVLAVQLAACQMPGSAVGAAVGWIVGYLWRLELLPGARWRASRQVVGMLGGETGRREFEGLRRRLRGDEVEAEGGPIVQRVLDQFRGR